MDVQVISNAGKAAAGLGARVKALRDMRPVLASIADDIDLLTAEAFSKSRSVQGVPFHDLADSTKLARLRRRKGLWKKAQGGKNATPAERAQKIKEAIAAAKFRPLIDTGRMRASARSRVIGNTAVRFAIVEYALPHITGGRNLRPPPPRNPTVFRVVGGQWLIDPKLAAEIIVRIQRHVGQAVPS